MADRNAQLKCHGLGKRTITCVRFAVTSNLLVCQILFNTLLFFIKR